ncbi:MAG: recombination protein RecR [Bacilli bacterium]|jgi:recombination protein RecR|nr:recombination protein RecR [Bacilli bacterium]MBO6285065.1 recombination protein RecR [Bacilli bacterium]
MKELATYAALVDSFRKLPGIGTRSAERMANSVLEMRKEDALEFAKAIENAKTRVHKCPICGLYTEEETCEVCKDSTRNHDICLVVVNPKDATSFEAVNNFKGVYHVLGGLLAPAKGIGPEALSIDALKTRVKDENIKEVIVATSPTLEGETTALFIAKILEPYDVKVSRLGYGLPAGSTLEYADPLTLSRALEGRKTL